MSKRKSAKVEAPKGKNHGRKRVQLMNGKGQRRMIWEDEHPAYSRDYATRNY